jgi:hypothetical protein
MSERSFRALSYVKPAFPALALASLEKKNEPRTAEDKEKHNCYFKRKTPRLNLPPEKEIGADFTDLFAMLSFREGAHVRKAFTAVLQLCVPSLIKLFCFRAQITFTV